MGTDVPGQAGRDSAEFAKLLLAIAAEGGADARRLAQEAQVPAWAMISDQAMIPSWHTMRLWELVEHALQTPNFALAIPARHASGKGTIFDYMLATSATLRDGLRTASQFFHLLSSNARLQVETETERETTYSLRYAAGEGRGRELSTQFTVAAFCMRARTVTSSPVVPVHVGFAQSPPRTARAFTETLGTGRIDFATPGTTFTFRARDLDLPLRDADPMLHRILTRHAPTATSPPVTWYTHFQALLAQQIEQGSPTLAAMARRLRVSPRTLQRQLAEHGSTWRAELDAERQRRIDEEGQTGAETMAGLARRLGYSDARSVRRTLRRWDDRTGRQGGTSLDGCHQRDRVPPGLHEGPGGRR